MSKNLPQVWGFTKQALKTLMVITVGWSAAVSSQDEHSSLSQENQSSPYQKIQSTLYFSGKAQGSSSGLYAVDSSGKVSQLISGNPSQFRHVDISTVSEKAVFVADRNNRGEPGAAEGRGGINVYTMDLNGENITAMTDNQNRELHPRFSPNGELVTYVRMDGGQHHLIMEAFRSRSGRNLLSSDEILDAAWSPDGQQLVVAKRAGLQSRLSVIDLHRLDPVQTELLWSAGENGSEDNGSVLPDHNVIAVSWSPDGKKIAYIIRSAEDENDQQLYVMHLEDNQSHRVSEPGVNVQAPVQWSRTNKHLLYAATSPVDPDVNETSAPTAGAKADAAAVEAQLEKQKQGTVNTTVKHVYLTNLEGKAERLTSQNAWHSRPVFSPDESHIAYLFAESSEASNLKLMTMKADGSDARKLYDQVTVNSFLQWHKGIFTLDDAEIGENNGAAVTIRRSH